MSNISIRRRALRWAAPVALVGAIGLAACGDGDSDSDAATANVPTRVYDYLAGDDHRVNASTAASSLDNHLDIRANEIREREQAERAATARRAELAEQYERQAHLDGQANTYADVPTNSDAAFPNAFEAGSEAAARQLADQIERQAHLDGQAKTHSSSSATSNRAAVKAQADAYVDSLEARAEANSNRAATKAQADAYVDSLEARAESNSSDGIDPDAVRARNFNSSNDGGSEDEFVPGTRHMPMR